MEIWSYVIAIVVGGGIGYLIMKRKDVDLTTIHVLNKKDFRDNMRKGQLFDVRKKDDFAQNKILGARNFKMKQLAGKYSKLRRDLSIYLYCNNGKKSYRIAKKLTKLGYRNIYVLENGLENY